MNKILLYIFLVLVLVACKKAAQKDDIGVTKHSVSKYIQRIQENQFEYNWFTFKTRIILDDPKVNVKELTFNTRSRKDSLLWMSVTGPLNVPVARLLMDSDSLKILQKINQKKFYARPFKFIETIIPAPVSYNDLENLLVGNPFLLDFKNCQYKDGQKKSFDLISRVGTVKSTHTFSKQNYRLEKTVLYDQIKQQKVQIQYNDYKKLDNGQTYSYNRIIDLTTPKDTSRYEINLIKYKVDMPTSFPFKVSSKYERI